jgi:multidrug resistance efflux pump
VEIPGTLSDWNVSSGTTVTAGEVLGHVSTSAELQQLGQAASNPQVVKSVSNAAKIESPISGTVVNTTATAGQLVAPGQSLGEVVDLSKLYVVANLNETTLRNIDVGDTVDVYIDAYPDLSLKGTVESIGLAANSFFSLIPPSDSASGTYTKVTQTVPVKISLSGYGGENLLPGMSVSVRIHRSTT